MCVLWIVHYSVTYGFAYTAFIHIAIIIRQMILFWSYSGIFIIIAVCSALSNRENQTTYNFIYIHFYFLCVNVYVIYIYYFVHIDVYVIYIFILYV